MLPIVGPLVILVGGGWQWCVIGVTTSDRSMERRQDVLTVIPLLCMRLNFGIAFVVGIC